MSFAAQLTQDLDVVEFRDWGETITYTPSGGGGSEITAVVARRGVQELDETPDGQAYYLEAQAIVRVADAATPALSDVLSFPEEAGGTAVDWDVGAPPFLPGDGTVRFICRRKHYVSKAPGYRRDR